MEFNLEEFKGAFKAWEAKVESFCKDWEHEEQVVKAIERYRECVDRLFEIHLSLSPLDGCSGKSE
jgi:hypothetical protein